jgi:hypothetical protein
MAIVIGYSVTLIISLPVLRQAAFLFVGFLLAGVLGLA